ncbi:MAG: c-type cytochrome [bacterium]|nr:c-type cytochrome [bacterium]
MVRSLAVIPAVRSAFVVSLLAAALWAQSGDRKNDPQTMLPDSVEVPPATPRSPAEELATFRIADGFEVQLVASEPLLRDPVVATFDAAGRLWVCEWPSYMKDIVATDENAPTGCVAILHDRDGDGRMDDRTEFLSGQILPRAVLPMRGGALVIEPPSLYWCPDADGDLRADKKEKICDGFQAGIDNPEHSGNGLLPGFDHLIRLAGDKRVLRRRTGGGGGGDFVVEPGSGGGQWGLALDDQGRFYFNYNSDWLRCDLVPGRYGHAVRALGSLPGLNHQVTRNQSTWPIRMTPGINRGYQKHMLRADYTLKRNTAVCSPLVYRGTALPCYGDVFVCEPAGNLVRRFVLDPKTQHGRLQGANPYEADKQEFLASTDERFRPIGLFGGQDGGLYVLDMYRGVIQHKNYVTSFLRHQVEKRGLEQPIGRGRIWRVLPKGHVRHVEPPVANASNNELVVALGSSCGTTRDLALRELVQRRDRKIGPALRNAMVAEERAPNRIAMMSALLGLELLEPSDIVLGLRSSDDAVKCFALQCAAPHLIAGNGFCWLMCEAFSRGTTGRVGWHLALAMGEVLRDRLAKSHHDRAFAVLVNLLAGDDGNLRRTIAMIAKGRQVELARALAAVGPRKAELMRGFAYTPEATNAGLRELARVTVKTRDRTLQSELFAFAAEHDDAAERLALLRGALDALPRKARQRAGWLKFAATPPALLALAKSSDPKARGFADQLLAAVGLEVAGEGGRVGGKLSAADREFLRRGERVFASVCAACHQLDGNGMQGLAPPLRDSEWATGEPRTLIRIALHGVKGPIEVGDQKWNREMAGQGHLPNGELASVLSYVRRAFGHEESLIREAEVAAERRASKSRREPWTVAELLDEQ